MPSARSEPFGLGFGEIWLLLGLTAVLALLFAGSPGVVDASGNSPYLLGALPLLALSIARFAHRMGFHCLHMSVYMGVAGSIGLLMGARLDFGFLGLVTLTNWCSALPALSLDAVWTKVALAPWSHAGMLVGCNLGMVLSARLRGPTPGNRTLCFWRYLACNVGMLGGMFLAEATVPAYNEAVGESGVVGMLWIMVVGMTGGMWICWWLAALMGRVFQRASSGTVIADTSPRFFRRRPL